MTTIQPDNQTSEERYYRDSDMQQAYQEDIEHEKIMTTEERLTDVRKTMRYYRPAQTFGREHGRIEGYYYTEPVDIARVGV